MQSDLDFETFWFLLHTSPLFCFFHTYPVQVAHTFPLFLIFSYSITALLPKTCRTVGPRIYNVALFDLPCIYSSTFLRQTWHDNFLSWHKSILMFTIATLFFSLALVILSHIFVVWLIRFIPLWLSQRCASLMVL